MIDDPQSDDSVDVRVREFNKWCALQRAAERVVREGPADLHLALLRGAVEELNAELVRLGKKAAP